MREARKRRKTTTRRTARGDKGRPPQAGRLKRAEPVQRKMEMRPRRQQLSTSKHLAE